LVVILALVFGGSAAIGVNALRNPAAGAPAAETVSVVVAAADAPPFAALSADQLKTWECPKGLAPAGALARPEEVVGRVTLTPLVKGEPILDGKLAPLGSGAGIAPGIPEGMRAFTIQTPNVASHVAGFILPGNKVDVFLTVGQNGNDAVSVPLVQNVKILAVDQRLVAPADSKMDVKELRSVTLVVTPEEALRLDLGQNKGTLHLALRRPDDNQKARVGRTTLVELGLMEAKGAEPEPPPPPVQIRTFRGAREGAVLVYPAR
jgi:pilus assembly protein CpaB